MPADESESLSGSSLRRRGEPAGNNAAGRLDAGAAATKPAAGGPAPPPGRLSSFLSSILPTPAKVLAIVANEAAERFAYYGIKSLLVIFLVTLGYSESTAVALFSVFAALCFFSPLLGSYLADAVIGKLTTIMLFNFLWLCGITTLTLATFADNRNAILAGLFILSLGVGGIKPNVSPLGAEQVEDELAKEEEEEKLALATIAAKKSDVDLAAEEERRQEKRQRETEERRRRYFSFFYLAINLGSLLSFLVVPVLRQRYGYGWAFTACLVAFSMSMVILMLPVLCGACRTCSCSCGGKRQAPTPSSSSSSSSCCFGLCADNGYCGRGCRGYYDAPTSDNSAWAKCGEVTLKCCCRGQRRCCCPPPKALIGSVGNGGEVVFRSQVDPLVVPKPLAIPQQQPTVAGAKAAGKDVPDGVLDAALKGQQDGANGLDSTTAAVAAIASAGSADADSTTKPLGGGGDGDSRDDREDQALLAIPPNDDGIKDNDEPGSVVVVSPSSSSSSSASSASVHRVPLFAEGDDSTDTCRCVNRAVEAELEALVKEDKATQKEKKEIVLLYPTQAAVDEAEGRRKKASASSSWCCCGRDNSSAGKPKADDSSDGNAAAAAVPHAALLPFDMYAKEAPHPAQKSRFKQLQEHVRDVRAILRLLPLFSVLPIFWILYDSQGSIWTLQRAQMDLCWSNGKGLCAPGPESLGVANPILVVMLIPLFDRVLIPWFERLGTLKDGKTRTWLYPTPLKRMGVGMQIAAMSFICTAIVQGAIDEAAAKGKPKISEYAQLPQFLCITVSEVLVSITGLEFAYSESPKDMRSTVLALYFVSIGVGDLLIAILYSALRSVMSQLQVILLFACLMSLSGIFFSILAAGYQYNNPAYAPHNTPHVGPHIPPSYPPRPSSAPLALPPTEPGAQEPAAQAEHQPQPQGAAPAPVERDGAADEGMRKEGSETGPTTVDPDAHSVALAFGAGPAAP